MKRNNFKWYTTVKIIEVNNLYKKDIYIFRTLTLMQRMHKVHRIIFFSLEGGISFSENNTEKDKKNYWKKIYKFKFCDDNHMIMFH